MASTTFYAQQAANRRLTWLLMLSVAVMLGVLGFAIGYGYSGDPWGGLWVTAGAVGLAVVMSVGSYYAGDSLVLAASQAKPVDAASQPQLLNVVQEMALAANLPMPKVYVIPDSAPNAFATGRDPQHASLAVTEGLLQQLDREELQGVIGHEMGHIRNLDIRYLLLVGVLVGGIALLADMFLRYTFWFGGGRRRSRDHGGGAQGIVAILAIVLAIVAPIAARLVQLSVSRQREYLADATSVEFTRNPAGLERALAKIAGDPEVLEVANRSTQHLYIVNPIKKFEERAQGLFSTHPPVVERIDRLRLLRSAPPLSSDERQALGGLG